MSLPHMILGLLSLQPLSGYDLNKMFQQTVQHFWTTDQSQIYRALYKLHENHLVEVEHVEQEDTPDKKVYHLTSSGEEELRRWLVTPIPEPNVREGWLGQIFFGALAEPEALIRLLQTYHAGAQEKYQALLAVQAASKTHMPGEAVSRTHQLQLLTLDYGLELHRFALNWLENAQQIIRRMGPP